MRSALVLAVGAMLVLAPMARGDWDVTDPYKMHFPQLPNNGGVQMGWAILADDWQCTASGPVTDIHFWMMAGDLPPGAPVDAMIYSNIPDGGSGYSIPGPQLWNRHFMLSEYTVRPWWVAGQQYWQFNIEDIQEPFVQTKEQIYWLGLYYMPPEGMVFWNFSDDHFMDRAVYGKTGTQWGPIGDGLAFVITPEPATLCLLGAGLAGLVVRRIRRK